MSGPRLEFRDVSFGYTKERVLDGLSLTIEEGELTAILGPNGCGKTTLLRLASRVEVPDRGEIRIDGESLGELPRLEVARRIAVVPQEEPALFSFSVFESVLMGRAPWAQGFGFDTEEDRRIARESLIAVEAEGLVARDLIELSGGERQRVLLARALAQGGRLLFLDEPTSHLDLHHQVAIHRLLRRLRDRDGRTVVLISHDINLTSRFAERLILLADGRVAADGPPVEVLRPDILSEVYGTPVSVRRVVGLDIPQVFPD